MSDESPQSALRDLAQAARALLEWEDVLGGEGFPDPSVITRGRPRAEEPPAVETRATPAATNPIPDGREASGLSPDQVIARLTVLSEQAATCTRCGLHRERTKSVFARGTPGAEIAFVGEGPGFHEDQQGIPFVGPAGQLLDRMIAAMGFDRDEVYVCNVVKCRPPENRTPLPDEAAACAPFLVEQLRLAAPKVIVALGRCATENLGCVPPGARGWRGEWKRWQDIPVMPTYHPAFLLRSPEFKRPVWEDLQKVLTKLGREVPKKG